MDTYDEENLFAAQNGWIPVKDTRRHSGNDAMWCRFHKGNEVIWCADWGVWIRATIANNSCIGHVRFKTLNDAILLKKGQS